MTVLVREVDGRQCLSDGSWRELWERSHAKTVFLADSFLRAAASAYHSGEPIRVFQAQVGGRVDAMLAIVGDRRNARVLGEGPSDYLDVLSAADLSDAQRSAAVVAVVRAALARSRSPIVLRGLRADTGTLSALRDGEGVFITPRRITPAPTMDAPAFEAAARKKSLRRHTNRIAREGALRVECHTDPAVIAERLPALIAQHIARWAGTETPSFFAADEHQAFYRGLVEEADEAIGLRLHEVWIDEAMVAAHLGFASDGVFTWYKPTFDPAWSSHSPGEVLLRALIEDARDTDQREFDFTVGDEAFKLRFATRVRAVYDVHIASSAPRAALERAKLRVRDEVKEALGAERWERLKRVVAGG